MSEYPTSKIFIAAPFGNYIKHPNAISVKGTFTLNPRGNRLYSILKSLRYRSKLGGWTNQLGLPNPGVHKGLGKVGIDDVLSIAETERNEFQTLHKLIPDFVNLELNLSCPNLGKTLPWDYVHNFTNTKRKWCIAKLSPLTRPEEIDYLITAGFKQLHFSNTLPTKYGGLSGPSLIPYTMELISIVREKWKDIEIIAGGGILDNSTIYDYMAAGANHVSLGSVCFNPFKLKKILSR